MSEIAKKLPLQATGLKLYRIDRKGDLIGCESVHFKEGFGAVEMTLRRAAISGRVDVGGEIKDHFADVIDDDDTIHETVALDRRSYGALKNHWMRCKVERLPQIGARP